MTGVMTVVDLQGSLGCGICIGRGVYVGVISVCMCVCVCVCVCVCGMRGQGGWSVGVLTGRSQCCWKDGQPAMWTGGRGP